jgi:nucleoside-diphosphate-sugar epimerase
VNAYLTLAEKSAGLKHFGEAFNFSSGEKRSVSELVNNVLAIMGSNLMPVVLRSGRHEIQDQYLSIEKSKHFLGWGPEYPLEKGLPLTIAWYRRILL